MDFQSHIKKSQEIKGHTHQLFKEKFEGMMMMMRRRRRMMIMMMMRRRRRRMNDDDDDEEEEEDDDNDDDDGGDERVLSLTVHILIVVNTAVLCV